MAEANAEENENVELYPLALERYLSPRIWGGKRIEDFLQVSLPQADEPVGESWQIYGENEITNGVHAGKTLSALTQELGAKLVGSLAFERYGDAFPLLAKFIDANDKLSIQVHPDDAYAAAHEAESGFLGKSEAWLILEATPGASIIWGFKDHLSAPELIAAAAEERLEPHLNVVNVKAGDIIYNPAGTVHAINEGIFLFEIQQASDLTYRLYDYGRRDSKGNLRDLHLEKAAEVADRSVGVRAYLEPKALGPQRLELMRTPHFATERWEVAGSTEETTTPGSVELFTVLSGEVTIQAGATKLTLTQGASAVLPAALGRYRVAGEGVMLRCYVPEG